MAAVNVTAEVPPGIGDYSVNRNVLIEGNTIIDTPGLAMFISSASGITVSNNVIINSNTLGAFPSWYGSAINVTPHGSIMVTGALNVTVTGNRQVISADMLEKGIYVDPRNTTNVTVRDNIEEKPAPAISQVDFDGAKLLKITGTNFGTSPRVTVNDADRTDFVASASDSSITIRAKPKKLKVKSGENTIQVIDSSGVASNVFILKV